MASKGSMKKFGRECKGGSEQRSKGIMQGDISAWSASQLSLLNLSSTNAVLKKFQQRAVFV